MQLLVQLNYISHPTAVHILRQKWGKVSRIEASKQSLALDTSKTAPLSLIIGLKAVIGRAISLEGLALLCLVSRMIAKPWKSLSSEATVLFADFDTDRG